MPLSDIAEGVKDGLYMYFAIFWVEESRFKTFAESISY